MSRLLSVAICLASMTALSVSAQAGPTGSLTYKVSMGGMNAGTFSTINMSSHAVTLSGNDVRVSPQNTQAGAPVQISGGKVSAFTLRILTPKVGEQMTVRIEVIPVGVGPGQRCTFTLDRAILKVANEGGLLLRPSELPKVKCIGTKG